MSEAKMGKLGYIRRTATKELATTTVELNGYKINVFLLDRQAKNGDRMICASAKLVR